MRYAATIAASATLLLASHTIAGGTLYEVNYAQEQLFGFVPYTSTSGMYHPEPFSLYCDDFSLDDTAKLSKVGWWGYSDFWDNPDLSNFTVWQVRIYEDDGTGTPGTLLYDNVFEKAGTNPQPLGPDGLFDSTMYYHEVDLGEMIDLEAGTTYWLGIGADAIDPSSDAWIWAEAPPVNNTIARWLWDDSEFVVRGPDFGDENEPYDVAFKLIGELQGIPGDIDGNGVVDVFDLLELLSAWGPCVGCPADIDGNDVVNVFDLLELLANWS